MSIDLGTYHKAWSALASKYGQKPASFAAAVLKSVIDQDEPTKLDPNLKNLMPDANQQKTHQHLLLREDKIRVLDQYAMIMGLTRHQALVGIIRAITVNQPQFTLGEIQQLDDSNFQLRKLGVNLNQIAHRTNTVSFEKFSSKDKETLIDLINRLIERTENVQKFVYEHTKKVWKLVNSSRFRTQVNIKKLKH